MKRLLCFIILTVLICNNVYVSYASEINVDAKSAILIDAESGRVLWQKDAYSPMSIASTTKIMTCIIALETGNLSDEVTVSKRAVSQPEVKMHLTVGEKQKLEDLLYALMLKSYNDAAVAIAEHIGGTVENFCKMMTDKAKQLGAKDTEFVTPNGLDSGNHHSTAYDMALITKYALKNPKFVDIVTTKEVTTPVNGGDYKSYYIPNTNRLLREYEGATGVKSGLTNKAGHCFVGAAEREGVALISVVLASGWGTKGKQQKWIDTKAILDYGFKNYSKSEILKSGNLAKEFEVLNSPEGTKSYAVFGEDLNMLVSEQEKENIKVELCIPDSIEAPILEGSQIGDAKVYINGEIVKQIPIYTTQSFREYQFKDWLNKIIDYFFCMNTPSLTEGLNFVQLS